RTAGSGSTKGQSWTRALGVVVFGFGGGRRSGAARRALRSGAWRRIASFPLLPIAFGNDQQPAIGTLAEAFGRKPGIVLQNGMDYPAIGRAQSIDGDGLSLPLGFLPQPQRHVFKALAPPLAVFLDVDDEVRSIKRPLSSARISSTVSSPLADALCVTVARMPMSRRISRSAASALAAIAA